MIVEIINVGTELLLGEIVNTNATYLQKMCKELGFSVFHQSVVGDNPKRLQECLDIAFNRGADCVITTGGLGPTQDDLTKEVSADFFGLPLVLWEDELQKVKDKFKFLTRVNDMPKNNEKQAYYPKDAVILDNAVGTANACIIKKGDKMIVNLPGPPKEMAYVVEYSLLPYLEKYKKESLYTHEYVTMGIGESSVDELLQDIISGQENVSIALYASEGSVRVRLGCLAMTPEEGAKLLAPVREEIEKRLGEYILKDNNLQEMVMKILPPYEIEYGNDFRLSDCFLYRKKQDVKDPVIHIGIDTVKEPLGEVVSVTFKYQDKEYHFTVPLLKEAKLSLVRLETRILQNLYIFLTA